MSKAVKTETKILLVFLALFIPFRSIIGLYTTNFVKFIPDVLVWMLFLIFFVKNKFKVSFKNYDILFLLFILFGFGSTLLNHTSLLAFALQARSITTMYVLFLILRNLKLEPKEYKPFFIALIISSLVVNGIAYVEFISYKNLMYPAKWLANIVYRSNLRRAYSVINNPNIFAMYNMLVFYLLYYVNKEKILKLPKVLYIILSVIFITGILITSSRSTTLLLIVFACFAFVIGIKEKNYKPFLLLLLIALLSLGTYKGLDCVKRLYLKKQSNIKYSRIKETIEKELDYIENGDDDGFSAFDSRWEQLIKGKTVKDSMIDGRLQRILKGFKIFVDYPIVGTGFGTFGSAGSKMVTPAMYKKYNINAGFYSDNEYIKVIVETGVIGTLIFGLFCLTLLINGLNNKYKFFLIVGILAMGMFYNIFEVQVLCFVFYTSLCIMSDKKRKYPKFLHKHMVKEYTLSITKEDK